MVNDCLSTAIFAGLFLPRRPILPAPGSAIFS
jgi:hypothetical protein